MKSRLVSHSGIMKSKGYGHRRAQKAAKVRKNVSHGFCLLFAAIPLLLLIFAEFLLPAEDSRGISFFFSFFDSTLRLIKHG